HTLRVRPYAREKAAQRSTGYNRASVSRSPSKQNTCSSERLFSSGLRAFGRYRSEGSRSRKQSASALAFCRPWQSLYPSASSSSAFHFRAEPRPLVPLRLRFWLRRDLHRLGASRLPCRRHAPLLLVSHVSRTPGVLEHVPVVVRQMLPPLHPEVPVWVHLRRL